MNFINDIKDREVPEIDILFVSNFSETLADYHMNIIKNLPNSFSTSLLSYRTFNLAVDFETFLLKNISMILLIDKIEFSKLFKNINFSLIHVAERFFADYNYLPGTLGHKNIEINDIEIFIISWTLFVYPYVNNSRIVFSGYSDNAISTLTYYISEHLNKECITFHESPIVGYGMQYIVDGLYGNLVEEYSSNFQVKDYSDILDYDVNHDIKLLSKIRENVNPPYFGVMSGNTFRISYWINILKKGCNDRLIECRIMNFDKPSIFNKGRANFLRIYFKIISSIYFFLHEKPDLNNKYLYFPLQVQPEASTNVRSPFHANQLATIENISKSLPLGFFLYVKEHPKAVGMKNVEYYRYINNLPNVKFVSPHVNGKKLLRNCQLLISSGGTTNFEALAIGKKAILLDKFYYMKSKMLKYVPCDKDIPGAIWEMLERDITEKDKQVEYNVLLEKYKRASLPIINPFKAVADALVEIISVK